MIHHQNIEATECSRGRFYEGVAVGWSRECLFEGCATFRSATLGHEGLGTVTGLAKVECHASPGLRKQAHGFGADSPGAAGDKSNLSIKNEGDACHIVTLKAAMPVSKAVVVGGT